MSLFYIYLLLLLSYCITSNIFIFLCLVQLTFKALKHRISFLPVSTQRSFLLQFSFLDGKHNIERLNDIDVITTSKVTHFYDLLSGSPNTLVTS